MVILFYSAYVSITPSASDDSKNRSRNCRSAGAELATKRQRGLSGQPTGNAAAACFRNLC